MAADNQITELAALLNQLGDLFEQYSELCEAQAYQIMAELRQ